MTDPAGSAGRAAAGPGTRGPSRDAGTRSPGSTSPPAWQPSTCPSWRSPGTPTSACPPDAAETLARTGRDTTTVTVAGGWHLGAYEHPEPYRDAIEAFLATLPTHPSGAVLG